MNTTLRVLIVEDSESDTGLIIHHLERGGYSAVYERVETAAEMRATLEREDWDVVLSNYSMPRFDAPAALKLLQESDRDIPFIVVSGSIGEDAAVAILKAGAHDYVIKDDLTRLAPAVQREMDNAKIRRERKQAERDVQRRAAQAMLTYEAGRRVSRQLELNELLSTIVTSIYETFDYYGVMLLLLDESAEHLTLQSIAGGYSDVFPRDLQLALGEGMIGVAAARSEVQISGDVSQDPHYVRKANEITNSELAIPIKIKERVIGVLDLQSAEYDAFDEADVIAMETLADQIAVAIENARLYKETQRLAAFNKGIIENMAEGIAVEDTEGIFTFVNPAAATLLGYAPGALLGQHWTVIIPPDQHSIVQMADERRMRGETDRYELQLICKDGTRRTVLVSGSPRFEDGRFAGTMAVFTDITKRKQVEERLRRSEADYRSLFENVLDGIYRTTPEGKILDANPALVDMLGYASKAELLGVDIARDLYAMPEERDVLLKEVEQQGELRNIELTLKCKDGQQIIVLDNTRAVMDENGTIVHYEGTLKDITDRKQAEEEMRHRLNELGLLYESGLLLSQLLPPKEIGQNILNLLARILGWHHTTIRQYHPEDETLELLAFSHPDLKDEEERLATKERFKTMIAQPGDGLSGWVVQHGQAVRCGDVTGDSRYMETVAGIRSGLYVPMKIGQRIIGVISVESEQADAFREADERLITTMAAQAAIALENARLFEETKQWVDNLQIVSDILIDINANPDVFDAFPAMVAGVQNLTGCERVSLAFLDSDMETATIVALDKPAQALGQGTSFKLSNTAAAGNILSGRPHLTPDLSAELDFPAERILYQSGLRSRINLPLSVEGEVLGALNLAWLSPAGYEPNQIPMLMQIANSLALAVRKSRLFEDAQRRLKQVQALHEIDRAIAGSLSLPITLDVLLDQTIAQLAVDAACVLLFNPHTYSLEYSSGRGFHTSALQHTHLRVGEGHAGKVALERRVIHIPDLNVSQTGFLRSPLLKSEGFVTYVGVPLIAKGQIKGVLEIFHRQPFDPDQEWWDFLETLAGQAAVAIDNATLFSDLQHSNVELALAYDNTLEGWARALELRDRETEGHTRRVVEMTLRLSRAMGISNEEIAHIRRGILLHDIGKMGVPDSILLKPGPLTDEEWEIMHRHPVHAYEMLSAISFLRPALDIPYCHHEKWDGSGYPRGLKGEQIPLPARVFAIVDVWDALNSDRPYRKAWPNKEVIEYIREQSGKHFDPNIVEVFLELLNLGDQ
ncbi:MAG: GAF domain-containing protein [Chloroflexota bacterium]